MTKKNKVELEFLNKSEKPYAKATIENGHVTNTNKEAFQMVSKLIKQIIVAKTIVCKYKTSNK